MSEFSEALFLRSRSPRKAVVLLETAKVRGWVFPSGNGWVPIVFSSVAEETDDDEDEETTNLERIVAANTGVLVHYDYAADHGCQVNAYDGAERVARLKANFEEERSRFDRDELVALGVLKPKAADALRAWVVTAHDCAKRAAEHRHVVARTFGFPRYAWLSFDYERTTERPDPERIEVGVTEA